MSEIQLKTAGSNDRAIWAYGSRAASLMHLGVELASDVVDVVERMHGTIERAPLPLTKLEETRTWGITGLVYQALRNSFAAVSGSVGRIALQLDRVAGEEAQHDDSWLPIRAAINGVCGDALEQAGNPLAQPMRVVSRGGVAESSTLVLFAHGLCMSELGWRRGDYADFESWCADEFGARTAHLRYNTGRRISINAMELAELLEDMVEAEGIKRLVLVGHSMGGLLYRSACHQAGQAGHRWPQAVTHIAMLGSPHNGSPWERLGNHANRLLKFSPYTLPMATFGDLRSAGIKDLRHGNLLEADWREVDPDHHDDPRQLVPLLDTASHLAVAASRSQQVPYHVWEARDDMLVTVPSALGMSLRPERDLSHPRLRREVISDLDHLSMMGDGRVWQVVREWLLPAH